MSEDRDSLGYWALPLPDIEGKQWKRIPKISRLVPFGYTLDPEDKDYLIPVAEELEALEVAKKHLRQYSYRQVANWLSKNSGRDISHVGLMKRLKNERKRQNQAISLRKWADYAQKAIQKAEEIEESRTGAKQEAESSPA